MYRITAFIAAGCIAACGPLPDVPVPDISVSEAQEYPQFEQLDRIVTTAADDEARAVETEEALAARTASLRARAARLRATSVE